MNHNITDTIKSVLDELKDTQFNIGSETARTLLSLAIEEQLNPVINQLIEDVVCPPNEHRQ